MKFISKISKNLNQKFQSQQSISLYSNKQPIVNSDDEFLNNIQEEVDFQDTSSFNKYTSKFDRHPINSQSYSEMNYTNRSEFQKKFQHWKEQAQTEAEQRRSEQINFEFEKMQIDDFGTLAKIELDRIKKNLIEFLKSPPNPEMTNFIVEENEIEIEILDWKGLNKGIERNKIDIIGVQRIMIDQINETVNVSTAKNSMNVAQGYNLQEKQWCSVVDGHYLDEMLARELNEEKRLTGNFIQL